MLPPLGWVPRFSPLRQGFMYKGSIKEVPGDNSRGQSKAREGEEAKQGCDCLVVPGVT